mmetsp:Transcript_31174/g.60190  ORF Transcript_31174/g.60190 Transcript_31174/m.60190 type:complete len:243 (-) Transcript_31174:210-938(-)
MKTDTNIRYDRIYVAGGAPRSQLETLSAFLEIGGSLVGPFDDCLLRVTRRSETSFSEEVKAQVRFAPLINTVDEISENEERKLEQGTSKDQNSAVHKEIVHAKRRRLRGPTEELKFARLVWTPKLHKRFPLNFRNCVLAILMLQKRGVGIPSTLSRDTWMYIFSFCCRDWFHVKLSEIQLLRNLLEEETRARKEAEARAAKAERDRAMMCALLFQTQCENNPVRSRLLRAVMGLPDDSDDGE